MKNMSKSERHLGLLLIVLIFNLVLFSGCVSQPEAVGTPTAAVRPTDTPTPGTSDTGQAILDAAGLGVVPTLAGIAPTRTPEPTATPDTLTQGITQIVQETGLENKTLFWVDIADWISLGVSLLIVLISYLLGTWVVRGLLPSLIKRTRTNLDDHLLQVSGNQLRWLVVIVILRFAVRRLAFIDPAVKTFILDTCFFLIVFLIAWLLWRLINLIAQQVDARVRKSGHQKGAESLIKLAVWGLRLLVILLVVVTILIHYGINITGFTFILGVLVFGLSLAARDIITDIISGAMILIDQPFRIGDRLDLPALDSWGDVVDIGMRSTKILTVNNREVVVPNSEIGKNLVVNYSYPDPSYYNTIDVFVAYDNDPDQVAEVIEEAIRSVEGVQSERDVDVWFNEFAPAYINYQASWWVATYTDRYRVQNKVGRAIIRALKDAGVVLPYQKGSLNLQMDTPFPEPKPSPGNPEK
jgi:MscS family membrane protein